MSDASVPAPQVLMQQAYEKLQDGRFVEAVDTFSAALAMGPQDAKALRGRGLAYLEVKRWSLAAADFDAARQLAPEDSENWVDFGVSLAMDNQVYPAIQVFDTLLSRQPECARGHLELGLLHLRLGAILKGREQLQKALACRPTLAQRRLIDSVLREQEKLDRKRYYRPDFEALHRQQGGRPAIGWTGRVRGLLRRWRGGAA